MWWVILGSSDMIFPRLNALSLWLVFNSLIIMFLSMFIDGGVNAGWTSHVPLSIILQCKEFLYSYFSLTDRLIGSIHYFTTGLYGFHVLLGVFLGIIMDDMIIIIIDYFSLVCLFFYSTCTGFSIIMELLIEEFLIHFPLILSLILQSKLSIESSKGIYSIYLFSFPFLIINIITNDIFSTASIDSIDVVFGAFWGISIGFMSSIIKFLLLLYPLVQHVLYDYGFIRYLVFDDIFFIEGLKNIPLRYNVIKIQIKLIELINNNVFINPLSICY